MRMAEEAGDTNHGVGLNDLADVLLENFLDTEGTLTGTLAYGQGVTGDFSMELDGESATGRVGHTTGLAAFTGFLWEGKTVRVGSLDGFNQSMTFSLGAVAAARFSLQWGPNGFQLTSAAGVGAGFDFTLVSNGYTASAEKQE